MAGSYGLKGFGRLEKWPNQNMKFKTVKSKSKLKKSIVKLLEVIFLY
jgi:hypothetical protein